jgi:hypothetical protein
MVNLLRCALLGVLLLCPLRLFAQALPSGSKAAADVDLDAEPAGVIPLVKGFNASLNTTSQHDSSNGWSSVLTPNVAWRFNRTLSVDAEIPVYDYIVVDVQTGTKARPVYGYATKFHAPGDAVVNGHVEVSPKLLSYSLTATMGLPSGNTNDGLGAGQVTYAVNNHFERSVSIFTPDIELGATDNSDLIGSRPRKSYVAVGEILYMQAGTTVDLPRNATFDAEAYEELPVASTTIFSTTGKGKKKVTTATNAGAAEDNGFNTSLDIQLNPHVVLTGFYSRSLLNRIDTAGFSFTFLLRAARPTAK